MNPLIGAAFYPDVLAWILFIGLAVLFNTRGGHRWMWVRGWGQHEDRKINRGSCWAITLTVIGWLCFAYGTQEVCQIINAVENGKIGVGSIQEMWRFAGFMFMTILTSFGVGLCFLFAAYILRSLEDALDHFKTQSVLASSYYNSLVEKDSPSVPPHEIELKDSVKDR